MKFGACLGGTDPKNRKEIDLAARCHMDFVEFFMYRMAQFEKAELKELNDYARENGVPLEAANGLFGSLPLFTGQADYDAAVEYVKRAFDRLSVTDVRHITFGSGTSRRIPEGVTTAEATDRFVTLCREVLAPLCEQYGVVIGLEPLNAAETNFLTTAAETAEMVRLIDRPTIQLLVDSYHFRKENESLSDIAGYRPILSHLHMASLPGRTAPLADDGDEAENLAFLKAVHAVVGADMRLSIEGTIPEPREQILKNSVEYLRRLYAAI